MLRPDSREHVSALRIIPPDNSGARCGVAECDARLGDAGQALDEYQQLLRLAETTGEVGLLCLALEGSARSIVRDEPGEAAAMLGRAVQLRHRFGRPATSSENEASSSTASTARHALGDAAYEVALSRGAALGLAGDS